MNKIENEQQMHRIISVKQVRYFKACNHSILCSLYVRLITNIENKHYDCELNSMSYYSSKEKRKKQIVLTWPIWFLQICFSAFMFWKQWLHNICGDIIIFCLLMHHGFAFVSMLYGLRVETKWRIWLFLFKAAIYLVWFPNCPEIKFTWF